MNETKVRSYIGFAVRSRGAIFGIDNIKKAKIPPYLVLYDSTVSENTLKKITQYSEGKSIMFKIEEFLLSELLKRDKVKVMGITNESLAKAIIAETEVLNERK